MKQVLIKVPYTEVPAELYVYDEIERRNRGIKIIMEGDTRNELEYLLDMLPALPSINET